MNDIDFIINRLITGKIFFFAGSGISYASNLPSAYAVLQYTANAFLPGTVTNREKQNICGTIQPEIFYESIISMTRSYECLDIWRSLYRVDQEKHDIQCSPSLSHLFISEYSIKNGLPIITTNFDSMFEQACDLLNINYRIMLPSESPIDIDSYFLPICKIHGSIQDNDGKYSPNTLWTTMTQITKVNTRWIEYIGRLMVDKHLCFVGYSGRDIDLFPYIVEFSKKDETKKIIWINRFNGDYSHIASKSCDALRVHLWPDELFKSIQDEYSIQNFEKPAIDNKGDIDALLDSLEKLLTEKQLLTGEEKRLLYCILLAELGNYRDAYKYAIDLERNKLSYFARPLSKYLLVLTCARLSHEISRYESCGKYAKQVLVMLKDKNDYDIDFALQADCLVSEAHRMSIPGDTYFFQKKRIKDYFYITFIMSRFLATAFRANMILFKNRLTRNDVNAETQHELIEHEIRFYALFQSVTGSSQRGWNKFIKAFLIRAWNRIKDMSYQAGYSAGIANSGKFKYRLEPLEKTMSDSAAIYSLITSATGAELLIRNEADMLLHNGMFEESRAKFIEYINMANKSGNALNEIKGIIGFAYANHLEGKIPLLTNSFRLRFQELANEIEGRRWREYFADIDAIFIKNENI
uniref:SIR2-like domain-containing protein n=1 Tax=Candidatus Kentrum sp. MB TaxID=2138164 RepID=A0A450XPG2_9GAMM|nr:MAG: SIR2-like domain-containing protein [Candidatus Kentron sp. MB]VFK31225.1 MAG: SIR2-like domain-containing protein [Candidatus Kentron sp. MB]VFK75400.1 MAG: SIR2-like domain-containing protein [Candidatus Kentron sp. MB]